MITQAFSLEGIPALLWGEAQDRLILAAHGNHSSKEDACIRILAEEAVPKGYQILSFDFPGHGGRSGETDPLLPDECVRELRLFAELAKKQGSELSLFGCSMGAYFELLAFADQPVQKAWFLSPVTDMGRLIEALMTACGVTEEELKRKGRIDTGSEPLLYPYYRFVKDHPVVSWRHKTCILRGEGDMLVSRREAEAFARRFSCELTEQPDGKHWFHTEEELSFFRNWLRKHLS